MPHFKEEEFFCKCERCKRDPSRRIKINPLLIKELEELRAFFQMPVIILSGVRCAEHNKEVGGAQHSQHILGNAADVKIAGVCSRKVFNYLNLKYPDSHGVGLYATFTHFDVRENKARWFK